MSVVYLYTYQLPVALSETRQGAPNWNRAMQQYPTNIYKNNNNIIDFVVRNNDRKPVKLVDCVLTAVIQNTLTLQTVLEKPVKITDEIKGRAQLHITSAETQNWQLGGHKFMVKITRPGRHDEMLFVDLQNQVAGEITLLPAVGGDLQPAETILSTQFHSQIVNWDDQESRNFSGAIPARNLVGGVTGLFTVVVYAPEWRGYFQVDASLNNQSPEDAAWFPVQLGLADYTVYFDGTQVTPRAFTFVTNANWIRFVWWDHAHNQGEFQKVSYKIS